MDSFWLVLAIIVTLNQYGIYIVLYLLIIFPKVQNTSWLNWQRVIFVSVTTVKPNVAFWGSFTWPSFTFPWKLTLSPRNFSNNPSLATPDNKSKCFFLERHLQLIQSDLDSFFYSLEQFFVVYMEYVCVYIHIYTCICVYVCIYTHICVYVHTRTYL